MAKTRWYYMHTLDGHPAAYDGRQVHFMTHGDALLVDSLKELRAQQKASALWRESKGYKDNFPYGYRRVRLPKTQSSQGSV
jgi:hypothetical protein